MIAHIMGLPHIHAHEAAMCFIALVITALAIRRSAK